MITFRREYLDRALESRMQLLKGRVLDVGGRRHQKRGRFRPPPTERWDYANPDGSTEPDFISGAENVPVPDGAYDVIVMTEVLEYVPDPARAMREMFRILSPGGLLLLSVPLQCPVHGDSSFDLFRFTRSGLRLLLREAGFPEPEIEEMGGFGAILFDALEAATGYAHPAPRCISARIARKVLFLATPFFLLLEGLFRRQRPFLTTGYFVSVRKPR